MFLVQIPYICCSCNATLPNIVMVFNVFIAEHIFRIVSLPSFSTDNGLLYFVMYSQESLLQLIVVFFSVFFLFFFCF